MNSGNLDRNKYLKLVQLLEHKTKEVDTLRSQLSSQPPPTNPIIVTVDTFRRVLVTADRNNAAYSKPKVTSRRHGYVDICYRNFMDYSAQELQELQEGELEAYKDTLLGLGFVDAASFIGGGIPARVEGRTVRVVRIPELVHRLFIESEGGQREQ